jgi:copper(I)-binding protein
MSPSADLKPGASVPVTLKFASGDITVDFAVKDATGK